MLKRQRRSFIVGIFSLAALFGGSQALAQTAPGTDGLASGALSGVSSGAVSSGETASRGAEAGAGWQENLSSGDCALAAPGARAADPGDLVTYCFTLSNQGAPAVFGISSESSSGWTVLCDLDEVTVETGGQALIAVSLIVPADAPANTVDELALMLTDGNGRAALCAVVATTVRPRVDFEFCAPDSGSVTAEPGSDVTVSFSLANLGNVADTYDCEASSERGWQIDPPSDSIELASMDAGSFDLTVHVPKDAAKGSKAAVTATARSRAKGDSQKASVLVTVGDVPEDGEAIVGEDDYLLSGEMGLSAGFSAYYATPYAWLKLAGPLEKDQWFALNMSAMEYPDGSFDLSDLLVLYRTAGYQLRAGDFATPWTGLTSPGTNRAGLDFIYNLNDLQRLQFTVGIPDAEGISLDPAWYGMTWSQKDDDAKLAVRLLQTDTGANDGFYLDSSYDWHDRRQLLSADLAVGLDDLSSAGSLYYGWHEGRLGWYGSLGWSDRINGDGFRWSLRGGNTYSWQRGDLLGVNLGLSHGDSVGMEPEYYKGEARVTLGLGQELFLHASADGTWLDQAGWALDSADYLVGADYKTYTSGGNPVKASLDLEGKQSSGAAVTYGLLFDGEYRLDSMADRGVFSADLQGKIGLDGPLALDNVQLGLNYKEDNDDEFDYALGLTMSYPGFVIGANADLVWDTGRDTTITGHLQWTEAAAFNLQLKIVHLFDVSVPRPHADISGTIYQDLDLDGKRDPGEPGIFGAGITLDGVGLGEAGADGQYTLSGVSPGPHEINADCSSDPTLQCLDGPYLLKLASGASAVQDIPVVRLTELSGRAFADCDGDGALTPGDSPLPGLPVVLTGPGGERTAVTGADGRYRFPALIPGSYHLVLERDGLPEDAVLPEPVDFTAAQEDALTIDLPVLQKAKPTVLTFISSPEITVTTSAGEVMPGGSVTLEISSDKHLTRVVVENGHGVLADRPADGNSWTGSIDIPSDQDLGEMDLTVKAWNSEEEPGVASLTLMVVAYAPPPSISATASSGEVVPGGSVLLSVNADMLLTRIVVEDGQGVLADRPADGDSWTGAIDIPADRDPGVLDLTVKAWNSEGSPGIANVSLMVVAHAPPPSITAIASSGEAVPGGTVLLSVNADMHLTRVVVEDGQGVLTDGQAEGDSWMGLIDIPADQDPGEMQLTVKAWNSEGEPGIALIKLMIVAA